MNTVDSKNRPVAKIRVKNITASIWENLSDKGVTRNVTFERHYLDSDNQWRTSTSYNANYLLLLAKLADLAHTKISELKAAA